MWQCTAALPAGMQIFVDHYENVNLAAADLAPALMSFVVLISYEATAPARTPVPIVMESAQEPAQDHCAPACHN
jgi:hypothetical protein